MKNRNRYTVLPILLFALIYVVGCAKRTSITAPKGWLPSVSTVQHESYGGWISVKYNTGDSESDHRPVLDVLDVLFSVKYNTGDSESEVHGELIAIHANQVLILTSQELIPISHDSISRMKLTSVELSGDENVDPHRQMIYPAKPLDEFRAYARFPQGLSKTIDIQFLKPKRKEAKILVPTEVLESPQKDQSTSLGDLAQQNVVHAEAIAAAEQDANTYVDTTHWFLAGCLPGRSRSSVFEKSHETSLPAGRLLGKSPEYVAFYAAAYHTKAKSLQVKNARLGRASGCIGSSIGYVLVLFIIMKSLL